MSDIPGGIDDFWNNLPLVDGESAAEEVGYAANKEQRGGIAEAVQLQSQYKAGQGEFGAAAEHSYGSEHGQCRDRDGKQRSEQGPCCGAYDENRDDLAAGKAASNGQGGQEELEKRGELAGGSVLCLNDEVDGESVVGKRTGDQVNDD